MKLPNSLIVVSTDLSHSLTNQQSEDSSGSETISRIVNLDDNLQSEDACGSHAINGLLHCCKDSGWQPMLVNQTEGYASFVVY
jgi:AmmeMemoRadiSam system protein B